MTDDFEDVVKAISTPAKEMDKIKADLIEKKKLRDKEKEQSKKQKPYQPYPDF